MKRYIVAFILVVLFIVASNLSAAGLPGATWG